MAHRDTAARRYAEAAFEVGREEGRLEAWQADLGLLAEALRLPELRAVVEHPAIAFADKERVLRRVAEGVADGPLNLVLLMVRRGRPGAVQPMLAHFATLVRRAAGVTRGEVRSPMPLHAPELAELGARLERATGFKVELDQVADPSLIGGVSVRIGDQLWDGSVRGRLERLRARLSAA